MIKTYFVPCFAVKMKKWRISAVFGVFFCKNAGFLRSVAFLWCCGSVLAGDFGLSPKMTQGGKYSFKKMKFIKI